MSPSRLLDTDGFNQLAKVRNGYCLYNVNDVFVGQAIEKYGEFAWFEAHFLEQLYGSGDVVIEVGANIGAHTVGIAKRVVRRVASSPLNRNVRCFKICAPTSRSTASQMLNAIGLQWVRRAALLPCRSWTSLNATTSAESHCWTRSMDCPLRV